MAGMAAFELSFQYLTIRQDRSFHFVQLATALLTLVLFTEVAVMTWLMVVLPLVPYIPAGPFAFLHALNSPMVAVLALVALLLTRASKTRFVIEPGEQTIDRLNRDVLEPCLGMKFDVETGKLYSDNRQDVESGLETFYSVRHAPESSSVAPAAGQVSGNSADEEEDATIMSASGAGDAQDAKDLSDP